MTVLAPPAPPPPRSGWPMTVVAYIYVRKDSTFLGRAGALLSAFVQLALTDEMQAS